VTLGWNLCIPRKTSSSRPLRAQHFTLAIILERMARIWCGRWTRDHAGGIPQKQCRAEPGVRRRAGKPVLFRPECPTSLDRPSLALLAAGAFPTIEAAQAKLCLKYTVVLPGRKRRRFTRSYSCCIAKRISRWGTRSAEAVPLGDSCPSCAEGSPAKLRAIDSKLSACRSLRFSVFRGVAMYIHTLRALPSTLATLIGGSSLAAGFGEPGEESARGRYR